MCCPTTADKCAVKSIPKPRDLNLAFPDTIPPSPPCTRLRAPFNSPSRNGVPQCCSRLVRQHLSKKRQSIGISAKVMDQHLMWTLNNQVLAQSKDAGACVDDEFYTDLRVWWKRGGNGEYVHHSRNTRSSHHRSRSSSCSHRRDPFLERLGLGR